MAKEKKFTRKEAFSEAFNQMKKDGEFEYDALESKRNLKNVS